MSRFVPIALALAALGGCTTANGPRPIDVTRFHLGQPIAGASVSVEPMSTNTTISPEYQTYADAVAAELGRLGFGPTGAGQQSTFIAAVAFRRTSAGFVQKRPPVTIGIGGGSFGGNVGVGGGTSFGIGGGRAEVIRTELSVQLRRRSDGTVVWEGKAQTDGMLGTPDGQPGGTAQRLAAALFKDFPGESGITITVK